MGEIVLEKIRIYDTARIPLFIRIPCLLLGILVLFLTIYLPLEAAFKFSNGMNANNFGGLNVTGELILGMLGLFFVSIWFKRNEIFYDKIKHEILIKHTGLFAARWNAIPLKHTKAIYVSHGRIRATEFWNIGILYTDGKRKWLTRIHDKTQADSVIDSFSQITKIPIIDTSKT